MNATRLENKRRDSLLLSKQTLPFRSADSPCAQHIPITSDKTIKIVTNFLLSEKSERFFKIFGNRVSSRGSRNLSGSQALERVRPQEERAAMRADLARRNARRGEE